MLLAILNFLRAWRRYNASLRELNSLGDALGGHRAPGRHPRQCVQPRGHPPLEGTLRRRKRGPGLTAPNRGSIAFHCERLDLFRAR